MQIAVKNIKKINNETKIIAAIDIILNKQIKINNIKIIKDEKNNTNFISFPIYKKYNKFFDTMIRITNNFLYEQIKKVILDSYEHNKLYTYGQYEDDFNIKSIDILPYINPAPDAKATATITLTNGIIIEGLKLTETNNDNRKKIKISFPTYKNEENISPLLQFDNTLLDAIGNKIINNYRVIIDGENGKKLSENNVFRKFVNIYKSSTTEKVSVEIIDQYKELLPASLIELWEKFGFGNYQNGLLKIINPNKYSGLLKKFLLDPSDSKIKERIPFLMTGFGDIYYYRIFENNEVDVSSYSINLKQSSLLEYDLDDFINEHICSLQNINKIIPIKMFNDVLEQLGEINEDEIFQIDLLGQNKDKKITIDMIKKINVLDNQI